GSGGDPGPRRHGGRPQLRVRAVPVARGGPAPHPDRGVPAGRAPLLRPAGAAAGRGGEGRCRRLTGTAAGGAARRGRHLDHRLRWDRPWEAQPLTWAAAAPTQLPPGATTTTGQRYCHPPLPARPAPPPPDPPPGRPRPPRPGSRCCPRRTRRRTGDPPAAPAAAAPAPASTPGSRSAGPAAGTGAYGRRQTVARRRPGHRRVRTPPPSPAACPTLGCGTHRPSGTP